MLLLAIPYYERTRNLSEAERMASAEVDEWLARKHVSLMFHYRAQIRGHFPSLTGDCLGRAKGIAGGVRSPERTARRL